GGGVAPEDQAAAPRKGVRLDGRAVDKHLRAGGDVEPGLDDAVIAQGDAAAGVCAQQAALPEADDVFAASGERAHDGGTPAHIRAVADDDTRRDASLHHGMAECAGVEVDEALMHDGGALREVGAETDAVGVTDAYTR